MKTQIIQIGNSQGIRIPKVLLEETGITGDVDLELHPDGILIRNVQVPRAGWAAAFRSMAENEDDDQAASPNSRTRSTAAVWRSAAHGSRYWRITNRPMARSSFRKFCALI